MTDKPMIDSEATTAGAIRQSLASGEAIADVTQIQGLVRERNDLARQLAEAQELRHRAEAGWDSAISKLRHVSIEYERLRRLVESVEWGGKDEWGDHCPYCRWHRDEHPEGEHSPDCELAAILANAPANPYAALVEAARSIVSRYAGSFFMDRNAPTEGATLIELSDLRVLADALAALGREVES